VRPSWLLARSLLALLGLVLATSCGLVDDGPPGWQGTQAVVSAHETATEAGIEILQAGGSAADAAVAVAATLSVVEPWFSNVLGGGTWALYYDATTGEVTSLDGVGPVGSLATVEDFGSRASQPGMHQSIVPGAWDGWMLWLDRYGRLSLGDVLAPAIEAGRAGYEVGPAMNFWLDRLEGPILAWPDTAAIYAPEGEVLSTGDTVHQFDLADTLETLAGVYDANLDQGRSAALEAARDYVYRGPIADAFVAASDARGGYFVLDDFADFEAEIVDPIEVRYDGIRVLQNPPNSQGIVQLLALNILDGVDLSDLDPDDPDAVHWQAEALKLAFADRHYHVGDPDRIDVPVDALLSDAHADRQRARISLDEVLTWPIEDVLPATASAVRPSAAATGTAASDEPVAPEFRPSGTTTFHVVDRDGNAAAVTTSLGAQFNVIGDTGIHVNNRMRFVALAEGDPNRLTPGYKVRHTSNPYMALRGGVPYILGGNTGADTQPQGQVQQFLSVAEFGLTAQEAVERPRFLTDAFPATIHPYGVGNTLRFEFGFPFDTIEALSDRGHDVVVGPGIWGIANMLVLEGDEIQAGADPRSGTTKGVVLPPGE
jgi:gamma-glutamyltranspeptidase/glutathione hydrolase